MFVRSIQVGKLKCKYVQFNPLCINRGLMKIFCTFTEGKWLALMWVWVEVNFVKNASLSIFPPCNLFIEWKGNYHKCFFVSFFICWWCMGIAGNQDAAACSPFRNWLSAKGGRLYGSNRWWRENEKWRTCCACIGSGIRDKAFQGMLMSLGYRAG